jgi:hypothetical protein
MERILKDEGFEARQLSWINLAYEAGIEGVSERTIRWAMGDSLNYHRCIACAKSWAN